jgi:hypothetical protein
MKYFGVSNSPVKRKASTSASFEYVEVSTEELAFDCMRHIDLLRRYEERKDLEKSFYFVNSLFFSKRKANAIKNKINHFIQLYETIKLNGYSENVPGYQDIVITDNGIRLDGSHRAAIAYFLNIKKIKVKYVKWHILYFPLYIERKNKENYYTRYSNKKVYKDNVYLGKVIYTDWVPMRKAALLKGKVYHILDTIKIVEGTKCRLD